LKIIFQVTEKIKPFLIKIIPISLLRSIKKSLVNSSMKKLAKKSPPVSFNRQQNQDGVNLIGYIQGEIGLGQSCRLVAKGLEVAEVNFTIYNYNQISAVRMNDNSWVSKITNTTPFNINIIHINPYELPLAYMRLGRQVWDSRYNIVYWLWELEVFPKEWENALFLADEIWTPSEFASESIRKITDKPVYTIPYALDKPKTGAFTRKHFNLPENMTLIMCMYDCNSTMERKNPMGALDAYKIAFQENNENNVGLVIKMNNPEQKDIDEIKMKLKGLSNIFFLTGVYEKEKVNSLISIVDIYISLHRAEGFGLVPAEAMKLGTPVIATNWSSNTEFMNSEVACMVDYELVNITKTYGPYKPGNRWAEPDLNQAAIYMKELVQCEEKRKEIAEKAKLFIDKHLAPEKAANQIKNRINEIYASH